jgi:hypothetical protein
MQGGKMDKEDYEYYIKDGEELLECVKKILHDVNFLIGLEYTVDSKYDDFSTSLIGYKKDIEGRICRCRAKLDEIPKGKE